MQFLLYDSSGKSKTTDTENRSVIARDGGGECGGPDNGDRISFGSGVLKMFWFSDCGTTL